MSDSTEEDFIVATTNISKGNNASRRKGRCDTSPQIQTVTRETEFIRQKSICSREMKSYVHTETFTAAGFSKFQMWKQPKRLRTDGRITEGGPSLPWARLSRKSKALLPRTATRMNLEDMMLRDRGQTQKATELRFRLCDTPITGKSTGTESRGVSAERRVREWRDYGHTRAFLLGAENGLRGMAIAAKL